MNFPNLIRTIALSVSLVSPFVSAQSISDYRADVKATRHGALNINIKGNIVFDIQDDGKWSFKIAMKGGPVKSIETSSGETVNDEYRPLEYNRETKVLFVKEDVNWLFNWDKKSVTGNVKKKNYAFELASIIHDPISFQLSMRQALLNGEKEFSYTFMRYSRPDELKFEVIGQELLTLENGRVHTLILKQIKPSRKDQKKLIWVSPEHDFIPVRFTTYDKDKIKDDIVVTKLWLNNQLVTFNP